MLEDMLLVIKLEARKLFSTRIKEYLSSKLYKHKLLKSQVQELIECLQSLGSMMVMSITNTTRYLSQDKEQGWSLVEIDYFFINLKIDILKIDSLI